MRVDGRWEGLFGQREDMATQRIAYLVLKNVLHEDWSCPIESQPKVLGRSHSADIYINKRFPHVSRQHAEVWSDRYGLWIRDLGSLSGIHINGVWVDHVTKAGLVPGDTIWMGGVEIEVVEEIDGLAELTATQTEAAPTTRGKVFLARELAHRLSPAEIDVMLWLSRGYQDDVEIGKQLHRSRHTVRTEVCSIFRKLGLHSRAELMGWLKRANRNGSTPPSRLRISTEKSLGRGFSRRA